MTKKYLPISLLLFGGCISADPEPPSQESPPPTMKSCDPAPTRVWKLTPDQYSNTVSAMIPNAGRPGDAIASSLSLTSGTFSNGAFSLEMTQPHVDRLFETARHLAELALRSPGLLRPCLGEAPPKNTSRACVRSFIEDFGQKGLRRPLGSDEVDRFLAFYDEQLPAHGHGAALSLLVREVLLFPEFLYRTELGPADNQDPAVPAVVTLTAHEKASALSYLILDGPPDAELLAAADRGELSTPDQLKAQVRRLLGRPEAARGVDKYFSELLRLKEVPFQRKTKLFFPTYNNLIGADFAEETHRFIRHVLWQDGGKLDTLLTANYSILNKRLATFYGVPTSTDGFARVEFPAGQRAGLLTQGGLLALLGNEIDTSPVLRGKFIRERILCQHIPPPPPTVSAIPPRSDGMSTQRERLARHSADSSCAGCHRLMDPLGLAFEIYDGAGLFRRTEFGKTIETAGEIVNLPMDTRSFAGPLDLVQILAREPQVQACFAGNLFEYGAGRQADSCEIEPLRQRFLETGGDVLDLIVSMTTAPLAFLRQRGAKE